MDRRQPLQNRTNCSVGGVQVAKISLAEDTPPPAAAPHHHQKPPHKYETIPTTSGEGDALVLEMTPMVQKRRGEKAPSSSASTTTPRSQFHHDDEHNSDKNARQGGTVVQSQQEHELAIMQLQLAHDSPPEGMKSRRRGVGGGGGGVGDNVVGTLPPPPPVPAPQSGGDQTPKHPKHPYNHTTTTGTSTISADDFVVTATPTSSTTAAIPSLTMMTPKDQVQHTKRAMAAAANHHQQEGQQQHVPKESTKPLVFNLHKYEKNGEEDLHYHQQQSQQGAVYEEGDNSVDLSVQEVAPAPHAPSPISAAPTSHGGVRTMRIAPSLSPAPAAVTSRASSASSAAYITDAFEQLHYGSAQKGVPPRTSSSTTVLTRADNQFGDDSGLVIQQEDGDLSVNLVIEEDRTDQQASSSRPISQRHLRASDDEEFTIHHAQQRTHESRGLTAGYQQPQQPSSPSPPAVDVVADADSSIQIAYDYIEELEQKNKQLTESVSRMETERKLGDATVQKVEKRLKQLQRDASVAKDIETRLKQDVDDERQRRRHAEAELRRVEESQDHEIASRLKAEKSKMAAVSTDELQKLRHELDELSHQNTHLKRHQRESDEEQSCLQDLIANLKEQLRVEQNYRTKAEQELDASRQEQDALHQALRESMAKINDMEKEQDQHERQQSMTPQINDVHNQQQQKEKEDLLDAVQSMKQQLHARNKAHDHLQGQCADLKVQLASFDSVLDRLGIHDVKERRRLMSGVDGDWHGAAVVVRGRTRNMKKVSPTAAAEVAHQPSKSKAPTANSQQQRKRVKVVVPASRPDGMVVPETEAPLPHLHKKKKRAHHNNIHHVEDLACGDDQPQAEKRQSTSCSLQQVEVVSHQHFTAPRTTTTTDHQPGDDNVIGSGGFVAGVELHDSIQIVPMGEEERLGLDHHPHNDQHQRLSAARRRLPPPVLTAARSTTVERLEADDDDAQITTATF